jgi:DNA-binding transcriptional ArsR family regulator
MSVPESWENKCCRCEGEVKETPHPGKRACHVTCGPCLYPDNPKCATCEIVGHCRLALDYLRSLSPSTGSPKGSYLQEQLSGEETLYHTLDFVDAQQHLIKAIGEEKYLDTLKETNSKSAKLFTEMRNLTIALVRTSVNAEKIKQIQERTKERNLILAELINRGPSTIAELKDPTGMKKSELLKHLSVLRQDGKVSIVDERDNQPVYELAEKGFK